MKTPKPRKRGSGRPPVVAHLYRSLEVGGNRFFKGNKHTISGHASRYLGPGNYTMRQEGDGARIWRLR